MKLTAKNIDKMARSILADSQEDKIKQEFMSLCSRLGWKGRYVQLYFKPQFFKNGREVHILCPFVSSLDEGAKLIDYSVDIKDAIANYRERINRCYALGKKLGVKVVNAIGE